MSNNTIETLRARIDEAEAENARLQERVAHWQEEHRDAISRWQRMIEERNAAITRAESEREYAKHLGENLHRAVARANAAEARESRLRAALEDITKGSAGKGPGWHLADCTYDQLLETICQTHEIAQLALAPEQEHS